MLEALNVGKHVSSYYHRCVLILPCVLTLLHMCVPHTTTSGILMLLNMCPHTEIYVSSKYSLH
jgi:hypothetical protein